MSAISTIGVELKWGTASGSLTKKIDIKDFPDLNISVSNLLQGNATAEDFENHIDIADWLIRWKLHPEEFVTEKRNITFEKVKPFVSEEYHEEVLALIEDLDLIIF